MSGEQTLNILLAPHVSEKAANSSNGYRQYVFKVAPFANKIEIRKAVVDLFGVKVRSVRTSTVKSKACRFGKTIGRHSGWKKAYVTLEQGQEIDIATKE